MPVEPMPCGHPDDPAAPVAGCVHCAVRHVPAVRAAWADRRAGATPVRRPPRVPLPVCGHLGDPTGETRPCPVCSDKTKTAPLRACAVHGVCAETQVVTLEDGTPVACCRICTVKDRPPPDPNVVTLNMGAGGLGDGIQGIGVAAAVQRDNPGKRVVYKVGARAYPFVELFQGYDELYEHDWDDAGKVVLTGPDRQINAGVKTELRTRSAEPRLARYARNGGVTEPGPYLLKDARGLQAPFTAYAGAIVLCPFSSWSDREYSVPGMLEVERRLIEAGHRTVLLHSEAARTEPFRSETWIGRPAADVLGLLLNATVAIGPDSGLAHLAAAVRCPTLVLTAQTDGKKVYGGYPTARWLAGPLPCNGCYWQSPHDKRSCSPHCPSLQGLAPEKIVAAVEGMLIPGWDRSRTLVSWDRLCVIRDEVLRTNRLPGDVAEVGVYKGGTAAVIGHYAGGPLHLFDTFAGLPSDDIGGGVHRAGEFACGVDEVRDFVANPTATYHVGEFPGTAPPDVRYRFAHLDGDTYQTTRAAIEYFVPRMVPGGVLVLDDYGWHCCPGVARAVHEAGRTAERTAEYQAVIRF